jgi:hypothetical protein
VFIVTIVAATVLRVQIPLSKDRLARLASVSKRACYELVPAAVFAGTSAGRR